MAARLTDRKRKKIIADYIECGSYRATGKKHGVSATTVKNVVLADPESVQKCDQKRKENTLNVLAHMETKTAAVCELIDTYLGALVSPDRLEEATISQLSTALGIVIDKFTLQAHRIENDNAKLELERKRAGEGKVADTSLMESLVEGIRILEETRNAKN